MSKIRKHRLSPIQTIVLGYILIIVTGAILLTLPFSTRAGIHTSFGNALFTATSATCVTGLIVFDTCTYWSVFGQLVILALIQIGGIGFMTLAISALTLTKQKIGLRNRYTMQEAVNASQVGGIVRMTHFILLGTALFEGCGALLLSFKFIPQFGILKGIYYSIFHAISAFCNAGFDLMGATSGPCTSLMSFKTDPLINFTIMALIVIGGIGFFVWADIQKNKLHFKAYTMHTKVVLITTCALVIVPFLSLLLFERDNPELKGLPPLQYALAILFQTVTPRTAGFNTIDLTVLSESGIALTILLMLIGGSPSSTAGGMKTTTFAMLFANMITIFKQRKHVECCKRRLTNYTLIQIISVSSMYLFLFFFSSILVSTFDPVSMKEAMFETASAIGTVGLSLGITSTLSGASKLILIGLMFFGRVGGLTLLLAFHDHEKVTPSKYPVENITIG